MEPLGSQQQSNSARPFQRVWTEALLNSPSRQATRRAERADYGVVSRAKFTFSALRRYAHQLQSTPQQSPSPDRASQHPSSQGETANIGPFASFVAGFIAANRVADARALLAAVPMNQRLTGDLRAWSIALAEPQVRSRTEVVPDGRRDLDWLRQHASDYTGRWIALRQGALVSAAESLRELLAAVDNAGGREGVLVHKL